MTIDIKITDADFSVVEDSVVVRLSRGAGKTLMVQDILCYKLGLPPLHRPFADWRNDWDIDTSPWPLEIDEPPKIDWSYHTSTEPKGKPMQEFKVSATLETLVTKKLHTTVMAEDEQEAKKIAAARPLNDWYTFDREEKNLSYTVDSVRGITRFYVKMTGAGLDWCMKRGTKNPWGVMDRVAGKFIGWWPTKDAAQQAADGLNRGVV